MILRGVKKGGAKLKKRYVFSLFVILVVMVSACSSNSKDSNEAKTDYEASTSDSGAFMDTYANDDMDDDGDSVEESEALREENGETNLANRMIIHRANLSIKVKNLDKSQQSIETKVKKFGGYIVDSNVYRENNEDVSGYMTVRIPEKDFQRFLTDTEEEAAEVIERLVSGQDITEDYVDLQSRLKSKKVVEERLLSFMKEAKKTEDLLTISYDLAKVQEEIEVITGKMKYYENQVSFSTIEIHMFESGVKIPELENKNLDTWEKTKKQFATSINFILTAGSGIVIFLVGNLPIILILLLVGTILYVAIRRKIRE